MKRYYYKNHKRVYPVEQHTKWYLLGIITGQLLTHLVDLLRASK